MVWTPPAVQWLIPASSAGDVELIQIEEIKSHLQAMWSKINCMVHFNMIMCQTFIKKIFYNAWLIA